MKYVGVNQSVWKQKCRYLLLALIIGWGVMLGIADAQEKFLDDLLSVHFSDETDGWVCGRRGTVLHTTDGGKTWQRQNSGVHITLTSIFFADSQNGWAVGDGGTIIHTGDGGNTWKKQTSPVSFYLMGVCFVSPLKGWVVTEQTHILVTEDGGENWRIQFTDGDYILKSISFCDSQNGWAVGEYGFTYHTRNGGVTWENQYGHFGFSDETGEIEAGSFLFDVKAIDPQRAWAVGIDGLVIRTIDGGATWERVHTGANAGGRKRALLCVDGNKEGTLMIGGKGVFLVSSDEGETWKTSEFLPPVTYGWVYGISQSGKNNFFTVGWGGAIYKNASEISWQRVTY